MTSSQGIPAHHPCLAGHFPGHPIVPGVVVLDEVWAAVQAAFPTVCALTSVPQVKFLQPLLPEQPFRIVLNDSPPKLSFEVWRDEVLLVRGQLLVHTAP